MRTELLLSTGVCKADVTDIVEEASGLAENSRRKIAHVRNKIKIMQFLISNSIFRT